MAMRLAVEESELLYAEGFGTAAPGLETFVVTGHEAARGGVVHLPEAHYQALGSSDGESAAQSIDALTSADFADAGFTGGEHDEAGTP